jgi:mannosyltransferase OCH1-like enzyme
MNRIVQGLWIGSDLSAMEYLSISSFLKNGHEYHLYVYDNIGNIPEGTIVKDASEILPASMIFQYQAHKSYSAFSNFFRYKLLLEKGGWWIDSDLVCLKPFDFPDEYVFSSELAVGSEFINSGAIKAPVGSELLAYAWDICLRKNPAALVWGEIGPKLIAEAIRKFSLEKFVQRYYVFCPIGYSDWSRILDGNVTWEFDETTYAIHLWNEFWRRMEQDKNRRYDPNCLYEQLNRRYSNQ